MNLVNRISLSLGLAAVFVAAKAQDTVRYTGTTLSNVDYHHGQLSPAVGVHSVQVFRANRQHPELADGFNWTYNHAPMISYWNNTFFLEYLSNPIGEHVPPGQSILQTSKDGYEWSKPVVVFPPIKVPDGWKKEGYPGVAKDLYAVMHQRMGFFTSKKNRLLVLAYYGIAMDGKDDPNDGKGIGRAVREIKKDGSFGPIYFIRHNKSWDQSKSQYPFYTKSKDKGFVEACNELLATPLMMQQWVEEADRDDPLIPLKKEVKAFSYYHLPDGRVVGLWKNALTSISKDNGKTWQYNPTRAPKFVNSNAKIWGQQTSDGRFATVYNPSEFRWPLAVSVSNDGLNYNNLLLVNGEISPMRYGGNYKSYGPQYVRGMEEGNGIVPDGKLWVTYSMNKEDIWVSSIPVPVTEKVSAYPNEVFSNLPSGKELDLWNTYSPRWAQVSVGKMNDGSKALLLTDKDRYEYAKAERVIPSGKRLSAEITVVPQQNNRGQLDIEFVDSKGTPAIRLQFDSTANFSSKAGYRYRNVLKYNAGETYTIKIDLDTDKRLYTLDVNGKKMPGVFFAPVAEISRITFRTGDTRRFPDADTPTDPMHESLPKAGDPVESAAFFIKSLITKGN